MSLFIGTERAKRSAVQKGERARWFSSQRSLGAGGDLLQVLNTLLVNQTDTEGGQVQDEALAQLDGDKQTPQNQNRRFGSTAATWDGSKKQSELTSSTHIFRRAKASSLVRSATNTPGEQVQIRGEPSPPTIQELTWFVVPVQNGQCEERSVTVGGEGRFGQRSQVVHVVETGPVRVVVARQQQVDVIWSLK